MPPDRDVTALHRWRTSLRVGTRSFVVAATFFLISIVQAAPPDSEKPPDGSESTPAVTETANAQRRTLQMKVTRTGSGELSVRLDAGDHALPAPQLAYSKKGAMLVLPGYRVKADGWDLRNSRLAKIGLSNARGRAAIRLVQSSKIDTPIRSAITVETVAGDIVATIAAPPNASDTQKNESNTDEAQKAVRTPSPQERRQALSSLLQVGPPSNDSTNKGEHLQEAIQTDTAAEDEAAMDEEDEAAIAHGEPTNTTPAASQPTEAKIEPQIGDDFLRSDGNASYTLRTAMTLMGAVAILVAIGYIPLWIRKKRELSARGSMIIRERVYLTPKHSLVRVEVDGRELLLGLSEGNIQPLTPMTTTASHSGYLPGLVRDASPADKLGAGARDHQVDEATPPQAKQKLKAFKNRLADALRSESLDAPRPTPDDGIGHQADAIRRELEERAARRHRVPPEGNDHAA